MNTNKKLVTFSLQGQLRIPPQDSSSWDFYERYSLEVNSLDIKGEFWGVAPPSLSVTYILSNSRQLGTNGTLCRRTGHRLALHP